MPRRKNSLHEEAAAEAEGADLEQPSTAATEQLSEEVLAMANEGDEQPATESAAEERIGEEELDTMARELAGRIGEGGGIVTVERIPLNEIIPSPTNPRKYINQAEIEALAANIQQQGLMQPIIVRPLRALVFTFAHGGEETFGPASREKCAAKLVEREESLAKGPITVDVNNDCGYEIDAGERRYRAHQWLAVHDTERVWDAIDCIVRDLTDAQVLEQQVSENLQREDLTPLDWANAYAAMVETAKQGCEGSERGAVAKVAARLGKSTSVIYQTIQLAKLIPEAATALRKEYMTKNHAIDCARLSPEQQLEYLCNAFCDEYGICLTNADDLSALLVSDRGPESVSSVRAMRDWVRHENGDASSPDGSTDAQPEAISDDTIEEAAEMRSNGLARGLGSNTDISDHPRRTQPTAAPSKSAQSLVDESEADRKARELQQKTMLAGLKKILQASRTAGKRAKQLLNNDDLRLVAEAMFDNLVYEHQKAIANLLGWEVENYESYTTTYSKKLVMMDASLLPQFLITCSLVPDLVKDSVLARSGLWRSFEYRYKLDINAIRAEVSAEGKPVPKTAATPAPKPKLKPKPVAKKPSPAVSKRRQVVKQVAKSARIAAKLAKAAKPAQGKKVKAA
jgi:ParB/RepB/Spo0J family partition protein